MGSIPEHACFHEIQIVMKCPLARIPYLGGEEALQCKVATLIEFNESTTLKIEVTVQADLCSISSLQMQKAPRSAPSTKPVDVNQLLMRNQKKIYDFKMKYERNRLPRPKKESHGKFKLWNALLNYCIEHNVKYEKWLGEKERAHSFESIVDVLWKINLASIERGGWKKQPPVELQRFLVFSFHDTNASGTKRKRAPLDENTLNEMYSTLMAVLDSVCFTEESTAMLQFLQGLCESAGQQRNDSIERPEKKLSTRKTFDAAKNVSHSCERAVIPLDQFPTYIIRMECWRMEESNSRPALNPATFAVQLGIFLILCIGGPRREIELHYRHIHSSPVFEVVVVVVFSS